MLSHHRIIDFLNDGFVFLTPNKRLVAFLTQRLSDEIARDQKHGSTCILPSIFSYEDFVDQAVTKRAMAGLLPLREKMHGTAELWLWESIIRDDPDFAASAHPLLSYPALAREAQGAFKLFTEWQVDFDQYRFQFIAQLESERLEYWFEQYLIQTEALNVCNTAQQQAALLYGEYAHSITTLGTEGAGFAASQGSTENILLKEEAGLCLYGFQPLNPIQQALFTSLTKPKNGNSLVLHLQVDEWQSETDKSQIGESWAYYQAKDLEDELRQACRWANRQQKKNPKGRFAVVIPQLVNHRSLIERLLQEEFLENPDEGGRSRNSAIETCDRYNLSSGRPLATLPMVRHWLLLLRGLLEPLSLEESSEVLLSPYFCRADVKYQRSLQRAFSNTRQRELKVDEWLRALDWDEAHSKRYEQRVAKRVATDVATDQADTENNQDQCELALGLRKLTEMVRRHREIFSGSREKRSIAEWFVFIDELVQVIAWPMAGTHNSDEYQQYQMFQQCRREIVNYSELLGPLSLITAIGFLDRFLNAYSYQRQTVRPEAREIPEFLGVLEACGQQFDAVWLCQMSDQEWPVRNRVNALLPFALQFSEDFPGSTEREHHYAQALSAQLCNASYNIVVSHCREIDETPRRLSSYIRDEIATQPLLDYSTSETPANHREKNTGFRKSLEILIDDAGCKLSPQDRLLSTLEDNVDLALKKTAPDQKRQKIKNGIAVLTDCAQLPLLAYLRHRLDIWPLTTPYSGLPPQERGTLIHDVLESVWRDMAHQQQLQGLSQNSLDDLLQRQIDEGLSRINRRLYQPLAQAELEIENRSIKDLLLAWIAFEKERIPFSVIATELPVGYCYDNYYVEGRVDRVDWVENIGLQLLDYKTGFSQARDWFDDQLSSPQLPLYALALGADQIGAEALSKSCEQRIGDAAFVDAEQAQAIAFANLRVGSLGMTGYCSEEALNQSGTIEEPQSSGGKAHHAAAGSALKKDAMGIKSVTELGDSNFASWEQTRRSWTESIESCFDTLLTGRADMLVSADTADSPYQALLRSGFVYNDLLDKGISLSDDADALAHEDSTGHSNG